LNQVVQHSDIQEDVRKALLTIRKHRAEADKEAGAIRSRINPIPFQLSRNVPDTIAIDGSYAPLFQNASMWLIAVRATALKYRFSEDDSGSIYSVMGCEISEGAELVTTSKRVAVDLSSFSQELRVRNIGRSEAPKRMARLARILREFQLAKSAAESNKNSVILMDGTLTTPPISLIREFAEATVKLCGQNGNALIGVSKDSNVNLLGSTYSDEELLRGVNRRELLYVKAPEPKRTELGPRGDIFFVKLHPDAPKWFRVDVVSPGIDPGNLFGAIAQFAQNQLCPGYPLPLLEAHMVAVEMRKFPRLYDDLLFKMGQEVGLSFEEIAWGRTSIEGRRMDAFHAYLDILSKRGVTK